MAKVADVCALPSSLHHVRCCADNVPLAKADPSPPPPPTATLPPTTSQATTIAPAPAPATTAPTAATAAAATAAAAALVVPPGLPISVAHCVVRRVAGRAYDGPVVARLRGTTSLAACAKACSGNVACGYWVLHTSRGCVLKSKTRRAPVSMNLWRWQPHANGNKDGGAGARVVLGVE